MENFEAALQKKIMQKTKKEGRERSEDFRRQWSHYRRMPEDGGSGGDGGSGSNPTPRANKRIRGAFTVAHSVFKVTFQFAVAFRGHFSPTSPPPRPICLVYSFEEGDGKEK